MHRQHRRPIHPGEILRDEFMAEYKLSVNGLGRALKVPVMRISEIVNGKRGISADTALRLARYFGTTPQFWINMQASYELDKARQGSLERIEQEVEPLQRTA